ncbi:MAG: hypothetical protein V1676_03565 [Candidatus Diapherotrites archaeon]
MSGRKTASIAGLIFILIIVGLSGCTSNNSSLRKDFVSDGSQNAEVAQNGQEAPTQTRGASDSESQKTYEFDKAVVLDNLEYKFSNVAVRKQLFPENSRCRKKTIVSRKLF